MIESNHPGLSVRRQAELLGVNRNRLRGTPKPGPEDLAIMHAMDVIRTRLPTFIGVRLLPRTLKADGSARAAGLCPI